MKTGVKLLTSCLLLMSLSACGDGEEEIVYEESPIPVPLEYALSADDTAPALYTDIFTYITENVVPPIEATVIPEGVELTKEEEKYLEEEEEKITAANELLQSELDKENAKLNSIRVVSAVDPTEANAAAIADATALYEEEKAARIAEEFTVIPEEGATEEQLSAEAEPVEEVEDLSYLYEVEQDSFMYNYDVSTTGFTGGQVTGSYVSLMTSSGFKVINAYHPVGIEYYEMLTPDFTQRAGTVSLAKMATGTDRLMLITIDWHYFGATVSVEYIDGTLWVAPKKPAAQSKGSLSISDAVGFLGSRNPSDLGLSGASMTDYNIYTSEGLVMLSGEPYREFIITGKATGGNGSTYGGTYLINANGDTFSVEPNGSVVPMNITNVFDTLS